ncbi:MAG TPA: BatD family protein [Opitutaceae bacterium]|nr:BatD family protein [Opitutaceae bacterium]
MTSRLVSLLLCFLALAATLAAQTARWEPNGGTLGVGQTSELSLVFEQCEPKGDPTLPAIPGLSLRITGRSQSISMVNFSMSKTVTLSLVARLTERKAIDIPAFDIETDQGKIRVAAAHFEPGEATVGRNDVPLESVADSHFTVPADTVWAGQVFPLTYTLSVTRRYFHSLGAAQPDWNGVSLALENWTKPESAETTIGRERRVLVSYRTRASASAAGQIELPPATQLVNLITGYSNFGLFQNPEVQQQAISSQPLTLNVRPLPQPAPASFAGAVGQFKLESKVVPERAAIGEPVTWTLTLSGTGNWPDIPGLPARSVSKDFQVVQPQAKRTPAEGKLFDVTLSEDVVLMPSKAGNYRLGPVSYTYFDPESGTYQTLSTPAVSLAITAAPAASGISIAPVGQSSASAAAPRELAPVTALPAALPGDTQSATSGTREPWSARLLTLWLALPGVALVACWLALALRRARATDPLKPRREAHQRLAATLAQLRTTADAAKRRPLLIHWQHDIARLRGLPHAAPAPEMLGDPTLAALWTEADSALYRAEGALPADWIARAEKAQTAHQPLPFAPGSLFRPGNLFPFLVLALAFIVSAPGARAEALADYRAGNYAAAEKAWREALVQAPTDWQLRHNLALALAQQDHNAEAAAQWTAAFVQHPDALTHRHLIFGYEKAGYTPNALGAFAHPTWRERLACTFSPSGWQALLVGAAVLAALSGACGLLRAYGLRARTLLWTAWTLLALALLLAPTATLALRAYGPAADARAVLVWNATTLRSIPTDADTAQKTTPIAAGTLAIADKVFLPGDRWVRLQFADGQTGWLRQDDLTWLWR